MVKKLQKMAAKKNTASSAGFASALPAGLLDSQLAQGIKDSAQHIWAAGLGAFAKAQGEGGKVFEALVKEGLQVSTPDLDAFHKAVQLRYQNSDYAKAWPPGLVERINAVR